MKLLPSISLSVFYTIFFCYWGVGEGGGARFFLEHPAPVPEVAYVHTLLPSPSWILLYIQADQYDEQHRTNNKKTNFITVYMYMYI